MLKMLLLSASLLISVPLFARGGQDRESRPTNDISIKSDFCSCINGKSDTINNCDSFCARMPVTENPILYVNTILGPKTLAHPKIKTLHDWCTVQLDQDETSPACALEANDGSTIARIPVNVGTISNSFTANIISLNKNRTWVLKLVELHAGSNAQTHMFQIRRNDPPATEPEIGALKVTPVNQYTCMHYAGKQSSDGTIYRTNYIRLFYYFDGISIPAPMPPAQGQSMIVCHDEQVHPGDDSGEYPRLETINSHVTIWDKTDSRFESKPQNAGKLNINKLLEERLASEYNVHATLDLFKLVSFSNAPKIVSVPLGYVMIPFTNSKTDKAYCPKVSDYNGKQPLFNLLGEYMTDTEGLYVAEKEETLEVGQQNKTVYGTMLIKESDLLKNGFYVWHGLKIRISKRTQHSKTIHYYWPLSSSTDPLNAGYRKLYTVKDIGSLKGERPTGYSGASDKRIGCIPK